MIAPDLQFTVDAGKMGIVAVNDRNTLFAGRCKQAGGSREDFHGAVAADGAGHKVVEHIDDQDGGMVELFHFLDKKVLVVISRYREQERKSNYRAIV